MKLIPLLIFLIFNNAIKAETINVPDSYSTIQAAINASSDFDTVLVSVGFYQENIDFNGKNILILNVTDSIKHGDRIDVGNLINKALNN